MSSVMKDKLVILSSPQAIQSYFPPVMRGPLAAECYLLAWARYTATRMMVEKPMESTTDVSFLWGEVNQPLARWRPFRYRVHIAVECWDEPPHVLCVYITIRTTDITGRTPIEYTERLVSEIGGWVKEGEDK